MPTTIALPLLILDANAANTVCGDCHECCSGLPIIWPDGTEKDKGVRCGNLTPAGRCDIQATKPDVCRKFFCLWSIASNSFTAGTGNPMPPGEFAALRPDRAGVIGMETDQIFGDLPGVMIVETRPNAMASQAGLPILKFYLGCAIGSNLPLAITLLDGSGRILVPRFDGAGELITQIGERFLALENVIKGGSFEQATRAFRDGAKHGGPFVFEFSIAEVFGEGAAS